MVLQVLALAVVLAGMAAEAEAAASVSCRAEDAELFRLYYGQSFKVIKNSVDGQSYLLMQNNSSMAARSKYCTGRIKSFVVPLLNFSIDTTSFPVSFFELLGLLDGLKGITSELTTSECVLKSYASGNIQLVNKTDMHQLVQFPAHFISNVNEEKACNFAAFVPLEERTPLQIKGNYNCLSKAAASLTTHFKPVVAWVEYNQGMWTFSREDYKLQYVTDAGGENVDGTISSNSYNVSIPDDMENFYAILCIVDVVIDQTYAPEPKLYTLSTFLENLNVEENANFDFLRNQSLLRYDKRVQNSSALDWNDGAISQPQLVLADLIEIFFPTGNYTLTYFRNMAKNEGVISVGPDSCSRSTSAPMDPTIVQCS